MRMKSIAMKRIEECNSSYLSLVAAAPALVRVCARVRDGHEATQVTHVHLVGVRRLEQPLPQELSGAVSDLAIALHLSETQPSVSVQHTVPKTSGSVHS